MSTRYIWGSFWEQNDLPFIAVMTKCPECTSWYQGDTDAKADYVWNVLADVASKHNVDVSRIYAIGYSGGSEFLSIHGWEFQEVFAGIQWNCGGNAYAPYMPPPRDDCKVRGRVVISRDDFLWDGANQLFDRLQNEGHDSEFVEAQCNGHCCDTRDDNIGAWEWFQTVSKCGAEVPGECGELTDLPPMAYTTEPGLAQPGRDPHRATQGSGLRAPLSPTPQIRFEAALARFDTVMQKLENARPSAPKAQREALFREAMAAYDTVLATAHRRGPGAKAELRTRYPRLRQLMAEMRRP